jgi:dolichol-phosphate mannosyltransferase
MDHEGSALIVIPTYNEAENLESLVHEILNLPVPFDILIVDDNSPDGTGQIANQLRDRYPRVHVLHRPGKMGLGTAYITGFRWALERNYDYILQMDCDFSHHPRYLPHLYRSIRDADLVIGSRYIPGGGTVNWGILRKLVSAGGNLFARIALGLRTHDCTGGYRCFRRHTIEAIPWDEITPRGYGFQIGVVYHVEKLGHTVTEFPIVFEDRRVGKSKMSKAIFLEAFTFVTRLALTGRYRHGRRRVASAPIREERA